MRPRFHPLSGLTATLRFSPAVHSVNLAGDPLPACADCVLLQLPATNSDALLGHQLNETLRRLRLWKQVHKSDKSVDFTRVGAKSDLSRAAAGFAGGRMRVIPPFRPEKLKKRVRRRARKMSSVVPDGTRYQSGKCATFAALAARDSHTVWVLRSCPDTSCGPTHFRDPKAVPRHLVLLPTLLEHAAAIRFRVRENRGFRLGLPGPARRRWTWRYRRRGRSG